jgi:hypothetical protein
VLGEVDQVDVEQLERPQDFYLAKGLIQRKSPIEDLYTDAFVKYPTRCADILAAARLYRVIPAGQRRAWNPNPAPGQDLVVIDSESGRMWVYFFV